MCRATNRLSYFVGLHRRCNVWFFAKSFFGSSNDRVIKSLQPLVQQINSHEPEIERLKDAELRAMFLGVREKLVQALQKMIFGSGFCFSEGGCTLGQRHLMSNSWVE